MKIHHLNTQTSHPFVLSGQLRRGPIVAHSLLIDTGTELILVETGTGSAFQRDPGALLDPVNRWIARPRIAPDEGAVPRVEALGYRPEDVGHIVLTHLDSDHAGGIADFPQARIHVHEAEYRAAHAPATRLEKYRYLSPLWSHDVQWVRHSHIAGEWFGLDAIDPGAGLPPFLKLIGLPGHTRGHTGVAIDTGDGWLLHAGDAYYRRGEVDPAAPQLGRITSSLFKGFPVDRAEHGATQRRISALIRDRPEVTVFSAHDAQEFQRLM